MIIAWILHINEDEGGASYLTDLIDAIEDPLRLDVVPGADVLHVDRLFGTIVDLEAKRGKFLIMCFHIQST